MSAFERLKDVGSIQRFNFQTPQIEGLPSWPCSPLLKLPGEIRNSIYTYALTCADPVYFRPYFNPRRRNILRGFNKDTDGKVIRSSNGWGASAFLRTCRQVKSEANAYIYNCEFHFNDLEEFARFTQQVGSASRFIKKVTIMRASLFKTSDQQASAVNLESIRFPLQTFYIMSPRLLKAYALKFYKALKPWIERLCGEKGNDLAVLEKIIRAPVHSDSRTSNANPAHQVIAADNSVFEEYFARFLELLGSTISTSSSTDTDSIPETIACLRLV